MVIKELEPPFPLDLESKGIPSSEPDAQQLYFAEVGKTHLLTHEEETEIFEAIKQGEEALAKLNQNGNLPPYQKEELERQVEKGKEKKDQLVQANQPLIISIAKHYLGRGLPLLDLTQEGTIGLMEAIKRFEPERGLKLSTYATWWIRQAVARAVGNQGRNIRLPIRRGAEIGKLNRASGQFEQELGREPTLEEIGQALDMGVKKVEDLLKISQRNISLEKPVGEDKEATLGQFIEDEKIPPLDNQTEEVLRREKIEEALASPGLTRRQVRILRLRFGFEDGRQWTLEEIGQELGLTRERIRQLEEIALSKLRHPSRSRKLQDFL